MSTGRMDLIRDVESALVFSLGSDVTRKVSAALTLALTKYEVIHAENAIAVRDDDYDSFLKVYLATKRLEGRSDKTLKLYKTLLDRAHSMMGVPISQVTAFHLRSFLAHEEARGLSLRSISGQRSVFKSFFGWLHSEGFIQKDPTVQVAKIKCEKTIERPFSTIDLEKLRSACGNIRDRAIIEFLRATGCRIDEVVKLDVAGIDFANNTVKVHGKGNKWRLVYFDDVAALHIKRYLESRGDLGGALFKGRGTDRLTDEGVRVMLKKIEKKSGVTNVHPHRFRRTAATTLIRRGMSVQDVAKLLGHSNINTTMTYIYQDDADIKSSYNRYTV